MASPQPNSAAPTTPGTARKGPRGGNQPNKRRFYQSPYANRKFSAEYYEKPYVFYTATPDPEAAFDPFQSIINKDKLTEGLPNGWKLYFHDDDVTVLLPEIVLKQLKFFRDYLKSFPLAFDYAKVHRTTCFEVDVADLERNHWRTFSEDLMSRPEHTFSCLALAMHLHMNQSQAITRSRRHLMLLTPRIKNVDFPASSIKSLSMEDCGALVRIRGNIIQSGESSVEWIWRCLACGVCDTKQVVLQRDGKAVMPSACKGCNHRGKDYSGDIKSHFNVATESQILRLQEARTVTSAPNERNEAPAIIDVVVKSDLVNKVPPGTNVLCTGLLKTRVEGDQDRRYFLYLEAVSLQTNEDSDEKSFDYSDSDYLIVQRMKSEANPLRCLVQSLCPKIIGQEMVKAALLLGMFSVSPKDYTGRRREAHLLLVGDPGLGKSELLEACSSVSPRGVFVSSNSCTNSGLTATMSTDSASKSTVEAGALVMADQGVCCIDELDKIATSMDVLLEAMEDQVVNIAKAGVINKLRAKTSVLAAANPIGGHYNKTKRITENLKIGLPVMSRFDLILILIDQKNAEVEDRFLERKRAKTANAEASSSGLQSRLKLPSEATIDPLPLSSFQKFLSFVNRYYLPELSQEAKRVIKEHFVKLRSQPFYSDTIPVTTRALLSLIRLTQARAKIDLCRVATGEHAQDVIELMEFGMRDVRNITEEDIAIQANMQKKEPKQSKAKQLSNFTRILQIRAKDARLAMFSKDELKEMAIMAGVRNCNEIIELMNVNGVLLKKDTDTFQFVNY